MTAAAVLLGVIYCGNSKSQEIHVAPNGATTTAQLPDTLSTTTDQKSGIEFSYPKDLGYTYVTPTQWPPRFVNSLEPIACDLDTQTQAMSGATSSTQTINGNSYCVWQTSEGAAGSVYVTYQLTYPKGGQYLTMSFTLRYPQCVNYPESQIATCQEEQAQFPLNTAIDAIAQSAKLPN